MMLLHKKLTYSCLFIASISFSRVVAGTFVYPEVLNLSLKNHVDRYFKNIFGEQYKHANAKSVRFVKNFLMRRIVAANSSSPTAHDSEIHRFKGNVVCADSFCLEVVDDEDLINIVDLEEGFYPKVSTYFMWMVNEKLGIDLTYAVFTVKKNWLFSDLATAQYDTIYSLYAYPEKFPIANDEEVSLWGKNFKKNTAEIYENKKAIQKVLPMSKKCAEEILFVLKCSYKD